MTDDKSTAASSSSLPDYFPFDGTCDCSRDGDLTLTFNNGSTLKTHSALLKMASPTFKTMLTDCTETRTVVMENTSRDVWVLILNCLHPGTQFPFSNFDPCRQTDLLADLLAQCRKFKFVSVFDSVDYMILAKVPKDIMGAQDFPTGFNRDDLYLRLYSLALEFGTELPKTADNILKHVGKVLHCFVTKRGYDTFGSKFSTSANYNLWPDRSVLMDLLEKADVNFHHKLSAYLIKDCSYLKG